MDILIIEDDRLIIETLRNAWPVRADRLKFVTSYSQSVQLVHSAEIDYFDGVIVDINLPDGNGLEILRAIRSRTNVPLILISGSGSAANRADAIDLGADDYVMKPFHIRELQARIARLVAVRSQHAPAAQRGRFLVGRIECDLQQRVLSHAGEEVPLTEMEARILETLYEHRNRECTKSFLYKNAFFRTYDPRDKTLDVYISRLRKKLGQLDEESAACIQTVRGSGYRYSELREE